MGINTDSYWMQLALKQAKLAYAAGEVPIGAVIVLDEQVIGSGFNQCIRLNDPTAHAEIQALRQGCSTINNYRLTQATMYVTVEPCAMCTSALINARLYRLVFGCSEPKTGACISHLNLPEQDYVNHRMLLTAGVLADEAANLMSQFFRDKR